MNAQTILPQTAATIERWAAGNPTADAFSLTEYIALIDAARTDSRIDANEVLDLAVDEFGHAVYAAAPWACPTCGGSHWVEAQTVVGTWASWDGPQLNITDEPCPTCVGDAGDWAVTA